MTDHQLIFSYRSNPQGEVDSAITYGVGGWSA
jgi:hypothetical protein